MFSSKLLFQVIALLTSQSNVVWLAFLLCLHNGCLLCCFDYFYFRDKPFQPEVYDVRGKEPAQEIQLHTWMDATLREIADLMKAAIPALNEPCKLMFRIVYPDKIGRMVVRVAGYGK